MLSRTWVNRRPGGTSNTCGASPVSGDRGTSCVHRADPSDEGAGYPATEQPSTEQACGKFPVKCAVSTTTAWITQGAPSRTITQSCSSADGSPPEGPRRRRVSHPSYTCPLCPKFDGVKTAAPGLMRFSFSAKNSSDAATTEPRSARDASSGRSSEPGKPAESGGSGVKQTAAPAKQPPPRRIRRRHLGTAEPRARHPPGQRPPLVRRQRLPVQQLRAAHRERLVGVERQQVGVAPHRQGKTAPPRHRPPHGQPELQGRDPAPRGPEVAVRQPLERWGARRVIGDDPV